MITLMELRFIKTFLWLGLIYLICNLAYELRVEYCKDETAYCQNYTHSEKGGV